MNYEGMIVEISGNRIIVKIDSMDLQLSAHFDKKNLELTSSQSFSTSGEGQKSSPDSYRDGEE